MQALDAQGARQVARLLEERVAAGWTPPQIRSLLQGPLPPGGVRRMSGLVAHRIEANVPVDTAPALLARAAREARSQGPAPGRVIEPERHGDPLMERALELVRQNGGGLSWPQQLEAANRLVQEWKKNDPSAMEVA